MDFNRKLFPGDPAPPGCVVDKDGAMVARYGAGTADASTYVYDAPLILALNVALATRRPLLLAGEPGSGKTTLARNVARVLDWAEYRYTVSSRTEAGELLWMQDAVRRLNDAYDPQRQLLPEEEYVEPGMLWWALAPKSAALRGLAAPATKAAPPLGHREAGGAVLLIDEIDKAEPDVPNDLLEVLDTRSFAVYGRRVHAERSNVLVVVTTNLERDLPAAFMRRCVVHRLPEASPPWFSTIAAAQMPEVSAALAQRLEQRLATFRNAQTRDVRKPGTAEYLDALRALVELGVTDVQAAEQHPAWAAIERCVFGKQAQIDGQ